MVYLEPRKIYDNFILGVAIGITLDEPTNVYSKKRIIQYLFENMYDQPLPITNEETTQVIYDRIEAVNEYFDFNIANAYVGPATPIFLDEDLTLYD